VDLGACRLRVALELLQGVGEPRQRVALDPGRRDAQRLPVGHRRRRGVALLADPPHRLVVPVQAVIVGDEPRGASGCAPAMALR
jgi:hypothetical protein